MTKSIDIHETKTHLSRLVAQAQTESMTLLANDDLLTEYGSAVHLL